MKLTTEDIHRRRFDIVQNVRYLILYEQIDQSVSDDLDDYIEQNIKQKLVRQLHNVIIHTLNHDDFY